MENLATKKNWTEEERLELAAQLDAELDSFIDSLEKKRYEEGWPEDRWQEEMDKHPFFMKRAPQPGDEVHPMFEGLQKLKYDPEENTLEELALNYKEDGNFYMKHKKFRMAVYSFSEGIKTKCENPDVLSVLYNNRSAAHYFIKNYRSALSDAQRALFYKPVYTKARWRAAQCAHELDKFDLCTQLCEELLEVDIDHKEAKTLLHKNKMKKLDTERNARKEAADAKRRATRFNKLRDALEQRAIKFDDQPLNKRLNISEELLRPKFLPLEDFPVHLDEDGSTLVWPTAFSYPEFLLSDFQQQLPETTTMSDCLSTLFAEPLPCDRTLSYRPESVNVYYENRKVGCVHKVNPKLTLREILNEKGFFVSGGSLLFYVVPKESRVEQEFIHQQRRPLVYS
ncbi:DNA polymerase interacting tetratricopeptide repeat-containing, protein of 47 kDa [Drosophila nasuta]|uniref:DNA polymerase interacting tetratricopeptide repeat-containing, protein of 47 kDa n=1 Tax=Drosophila albomicans TaxID=7291 RepID=A0A6P8WGN9_DROAB|nr:DNA polymerase interacting tetratricopeptide repeat-containing, protein of 47 kDa [Drosophila albomicans]XP_060655592.1 DNA polymerase interacting tetratricopeptide repeat-containing, protein of 47 kDa [Drosophila nasuta]